MIQTLIFTIIGSAIGGAFRVILSLLINLKYSKGNDAFPWGVLVVNVLGCFLMGILYTYFKNREDGVLQIFLMTGILGGFTTFSTFSMEALQLFEQGDLLKTALYIFGTVFVGLFACFLGSKILFV